MKIFGNNTPYDKYERPEKGIAVGLGNFDGVHKGHAALVRTLVAEAKKRGLDSLVYTFEKHPMNVFGGGGTVKLIMTNETKAEIMAGLGVDGIFFEGFDREYAAMDCETFARDIVAGKLNASLCVVGSNYSFGRGGAGGPKELRELGVRYGFEVAEIEPVKIGDRLVSSTLLRELISDGKVDEYPIYAGRPYVIPGRVQHGREVGRSIGFRTANIIPRRGFAIPPDGVYATVTEVKGTRYRGVTNIGRNPTFGTNRRSVETHLFEASGDFYGSFIEVTFVKRLRGEIKFDSAELLSAQIAKDKLAAEEALSGIEL
ncbi:MAG: bifunctional riboflavin kinase/FAD synthetase [Clostridia bacterium]|nr:bifunctional riboflavin kinase/FAD synthetase [Clostridia bacterium]